MSAQADRLAEIANICAGNAASVLATLLDATLLIEPPVVHRLAPGRPLNSLFAREDCVAAVFAEIDGALPAQAALLLSATAVDEVLARVAGKRADETSEVSTLSVLAEVGNIAVSSAANALAEIVGERVLPSVPRAGHARQGVLAMPELESVVARSRSVFEVEMVERAGPLRLRFVLVPSAAPID